MGSHIGLDLTEPILIYITGITDPEGIVNFARMSEYYNRIADNARMTWRGDLITDGYCVSADACRECRSVAVGTGVYDNTCNVNIMIVAPS